MKSFFGCECGSFLDFFVNKIQEMWNEVDDIMTQNAASNVEKRHNNVETVNNKDKKMFAVAMHQLPLFEDDIEGKKKPSTSSTITHSNSFKNTKKSQAEYKQQLQQQYVSVERDLSQLNKSQTSSNQNAKDHSKDSEYAEDNEWEVVDLDGNTK